MSDPARGSTSRHAAAFAHSAIARGHSIHRVFFLESGTRCGNASAVFGQDEESLLGSFVSLSEQHGVDLVLCVSSALKYGQLDEQEARRHARSGPTVHPAFTISGLGQLIDAGAKSDRLITFGA